MRTVATKFHGRLLLATAAAVIAAAALAGSAGATFPGRNGLIAFFAPTADGNQIFTVAPDGSGLTQLTSIPGVDAIGPKWSANGRKIAFELDGFEGNCANVALMNADGSDLTVLPADPGACEAGPSFSPDGSTLIYERCLCADGPPPPGGDAIWSMKLDGTDRHLVTAGNGQGAGTPEYAPNGKTISFIAPDSTGFGAAIYTAKPDGSNLRQLTPFALNISSKLSWSPNGQYLVFNSPIDQPSTNVAVIRRDGSDFHYLTNFSGDSEKGVSGSYSPDGHWIVYRYELNGSYGLYEMRPDSSDKHPILPLGALRPRGIDWGVHACSGTRC